MSDIAMFRQLWGRIIGRRGARLRNPCGVSWKSSKPKFPKFSPQSCGPS